MKLSIKFFKIRENELKIESICSDLDYYDKFSRKATSG